MDIASEILTRALAYGTPLLLGTLGEIYAERSGVLNLGVEGMMLIGALTGFAFALATKSVWIGFLAAGLAGGLASLIHAFFSITMKSRIQVVSGLALTLFGVGITGVLGQAWEGKPLGFTAPVVSVPLLEKVPVLSALSGQSVLVYVGIAAAILMWFVLYKTSWGISIRSTGEDPAAADSLGVNVSAVRYACVFIGGFLAGVAGAYMSIAYRPSWTKGMTGGMGWIVIGLTIFSFWNPLVAMAGAYLFGSLFYLSYRLQPYMTPEFLMMMPYLFTILVLVALNAVKAIRRRMNVPASLGLPYSRE
jgi:ABC-type uncharacterized transport system permease subunit